MGYALKEANNFRNDNLSNSGYQKNYNTIEFCDIELVFALFSVLKIKNFVSAIGKIYN